MEDALWSLTLEPTGANLKTLGDCIDAAQFLKWLAGKGSDCSGLGTERLIKRVAKGMAQLSRKSR